MALGGPTTDPPAQLVQLGEPKLLGVLDEHERGLRHVDADFDDRGRHQGFDSAGAELPKDPLFFFGRHPAVELADGMGLEGFANARILRFNGFGVLLAVVEDAGIHDVSLMPELEFTADEGPDLGQRIGRPQVRPDLAAPRGLLIKHADVEVAVQGQAEGAGYGRGGHHQQVRIAALAQEALSLGHAEAVLFVDNHQAQPLGQEARFDEGVGAHGEAHVAESEVQAGFGARLHAGGPKMNGDLQRFEPSPEVGVKLLGQDFGGGHHHGRISALERHQCRRGRH